MEINGGFKITEEVLKKYEITATWIVELRLSAALNIIFRTRKMKPEEAIVAQILINNSFLPITDLYNGLVSYKHHFDGNNFIKKEEALHYLYESAQAVDSFNDFFKKFLDIDLVKEHKDKNIYPLLDEMKKFRNQMQHRNNNLKYNEYVTLVLNGYDRYDGSIAFNVWGWETINNINYMKVIGTKINNKIQEYIIETLEYLLNETNHLFEIFGEDMKKELALMGIKK